MMAISIVSLTGEGRSRLYCLVNPGEADTLKMEVEALKGEQAKCHQIEKENLMMDLGKFKSECELIKQKANNTTRDNMKLMDERHGLELQLTKVGDRHKQLEETSLEKKNCEKTKGQLEVEVMDLKKEQNECGLLKQKAKNTTRENKKLLDENHKLELQLMKSGECHKQLKKHRCR